jgi:peptidyl-prolyl cis-trans isomerase SurA
MAAIFDFPLLPFLPRCRALGAVALMIAAGIAAGVGIGAEGLTGAQAQIVAAFVNGEPITQLDIDQRGKLIEAFSPTHKAPTRQEALDELIDERLKIREAKRWGIDPSDPEIANGKAVKAPVR